MPDADNPQIGKSVMTEKELPKKILSKIRVEMEKSGFDVLFLMKEPNIRYVSGLLLSIYSRPIAAVIPLESEPVFVAPVVETADFGRADPYDFDQRLSRSIWIKDIRTWYEFEAFPGAISDPFVIYKNILQERNLLTANIGLDGTFPGGVPYLVYRRFCEDFPRATFKDCSSLIDKCRAVKLPEEIEFIRAAAELCDVGVRNSIKWAREGISEQEIDAVGNYQILVSAAESYPRYIINMPYTDTQSGPDRSAWAGHNFSTPRKFGKGDVVVHSRQVSVQGYNAECERTFFLGKPGEKAAEIVEVVIEAQQAGIEKIRPGIKCCEVFDACAAVFKKYGYEKHIGARMGHSIGIEGHDPPPDFRSYPRDETVLEPGMTFSMEPGCYQRGVGGCRNSDTILVTQAGNESLTKLPKGLEAMTLFI
jgi:Xaa-Pro dipeptidase